MPALRLRFKKRNDGQCVLTAVRADGTFTSSNIGTVGGYGPVHDLTHLVVERTLGIRNGFLGLLAQGRDIQDFDRNSKAWLTADAYAAEAIAGQMSQEYATRQPLSVDDFNWTTRANSAPELTAEQLASMRAQLDELVAKWRAIAPGETMELEVNLDGD
jgi:hypothetical protein